VLQAIYDGPFDVYNFVVKPVILDKMPSQEDGDVTLEPVQVQPGAIIIDDGGNLVSLNEGINYRPSGCMQSECAQSYAGEETVTMDQMVVGFHISPGIQWSDGTPLTARDSIYSYEVVKGLFAMNALETLRFIDSYQAVDELAIEWRGIPGFQDARYDTKFFTPLPFHAWGALPLESLLSADVSTRTPLGWGPYIIDEWVSGDHISLSRNEKYFRAGEGLPHFDHLVFRFMVSGEEALDALLVGECDLVDRTAMLEDQVPRLLDLQDADRLVLAFQTGTAWEQAAFGVASLDALRPDIFGLKEVRQAVAMCIDRHKMVTDLLFGQSVVPDTYMHPDHPLYNPETNRYPFDPQEAGALLESVGWVDPDSDPTTPRIAQGVPGVTDGTAFEFVYLAPDDAERPAAAQIVEESLAQCGIQVEVELQEWESLLSSGPEGPVFGRQFDMAQFAWASSIDPPCYLFTTGEVPGPYPDFPKGWGGGNATGYSQVEYDQFCAQTRYSLPGTAEYQHAHEKAQEIYAQDLPAIPLYLRYKLIAMRSDMCGVEVDPSGSNPLGNLEMFDYGEGCEQ
jgi:peptide/nickel transport system substrate-binding protein